MFHALKRVRDGVLSLVFPVNCTLCGVRTESRPLCDTCSDSLIWVTGKSCARCGCPTKAAACVNCADRPQLFDRLVVPWVFCDGVQDLLHGLKYEGKTFVAPVIGGAIASRLESVLGVGAEPLVVPVPLHRARVRERGYNQSLLIAEIVGRQTGWELSQALFRSRSTATQTLLGREERERNVKGAFGVNGQEPDLPPWNVTSPKVRIWT